MNQSSIRVIAMDGELEYSRKGELQTALQLTGQESAVLIDFSGVTYADSTALAELMRFYASSAQHKLPIALLIQSRQFARVIEYAGLSAVLQVFDNRATALSYLGAQQA